MSRETPLLNDGSNNHSHNHNNSFIQIEIDTSLFCLFKFSGTKLFCTHIRDIRFAREKPWTVNERFCFFKKNDFCLAVVISILYCIDFLKRPSRQAVHSKTIFWYSKWAKELHRRAKVVNQMNVGNQLRKTALCRQLQDKNYSEQFYMKQQRVVGNKRKSHRTIVDAMM